MELLIIPVVIVFGVLIARGLWWSDTARLRRSLRQAPRATVADAGEGQAVRLDGRVLAGDTMTAPLTGRCCVLYLALVEEWVSNGKTGSWRQRIRELRSVPFAVDDGTGRVLVDATCAKVDVELDSSTRSGTFDDASPVEEEFLARHGMKSTGWWLNRTLRYSEGVIEVGEQVALMGLPVREPDPDAVGRVAGYREAPPTRLRLGGSPEQPILISDVAKVTAAR